MFIQGELNDASRGRRAGERVSRPGLAARISVQAQRSASALAKLDRTLASQEVKLQIFELAGKSRGRADQLSWPKRGYKFVDACHLVRLFISQARPVSTKQGNARHPDGNELLCCEQRDSWAATWICLARGLDKTRLSCDSETIFGRHLASSMIVRLQPVRPATEFGELGDEMAVR